jgi:Tfp pilus assembly protein PilO
MAAREGDFLLGISEVRSSIPATPDGAALIEDINSIAEATGVELLTFSPALPVESSIPGLVEIQMQLTFEAPYFKVLSFVFALEDLERLVRVDQMAITSRLLEDGTNLLSTSLTASAFSSSDLSGLTPAEATP